MRWLRQNLSFVLFMLGLLVTRSSFADHYLVPSGSMENTLFPGDRVVVDKRAYGLRLPFTLVRLTRQGGGPDVPAIQVPAGQVFVMGDFRGNSRDSRYFGFVREEAIYAKAAGVYYRSGDGFGWHPL